MWYGWLIAGFAAGVAAMLPLAWWAARRTERRVRRLEQRARAAERLAAIGTMTGGLAHEIKNPLSTIGLNLQLTQEALNEAEIDEPHAGRLRRRIEALSREAERLRDILEDFLRFAGRMKLDRQPVQVNDLVSELVDFYAPQAEQSGVQLRARYGEDLPDVAIDPSLIKQATLNLLINATQAMVEARYGDKPHGGAADLIVSTEAAGDEVRIHVIDTGPGISDEMLQRIFQPYFSTKKGGSGLGLSVSQRIAEEHGGRLDVHSDLGKGTAFTLALPTSAPEGEEAETT